SAPGSSIPEERRVPLNALGTALIPGDESLPWELEPNPFHADPDEVASQNGQKSANDLLSSVSSLSSTPVSSVSSLPSSPTPEGWPHPPDEAAFHGLPGQIVRAIEPHSEADPVAILAQVLAVVGNQIGRGPHFVVEADEHHPNLYVCLIG